MIFTLILTFIIVWALVLWGIYFSQQHLINLDHYAGATLEKQPMVSIVMAVRDGEEEIETTVTKLCELTYPNFEIIVVNDRSSDKTEEILIKLQKIFSKLNIISIYELPPCWLGKVHALHRGVTAAKGDYVVFIDADVLVTEKLLVSALNVVQKKRLDHLAILPKIVSHDFLLNTMIATSIFLFVLSAKTWLSIEERPLKAIKGVGHFNLIRREAFLQTEGFNWLKMDVADDIALSQLIAKNGGRSLLIKAGDVGEPFFWYQDLGQFIRGLEKNIVGGFTNYRLSLVVLLTLFFWLISFVPLYLLLHLYNFKYCFLLVIYFTINLYFSFKIKKYIKQKVSNIFLLPFGISFFGFILARSAINCFYNRGISLRGTFYHLKDLKEGSRIKLGF